MRKRLSVIVVACVFACAMSIMLAGCAGDSTYEPEGKSPTVSSPTIGQSGTLRVGVNTEKSPLAGMSSDGERIIGIDVDVAAAIADELGLKLSIVDVGSDPAGALSNGKVDIVMDIDSSDAPSGVWVSERYVPTGIALFALSSSQSGSLRSRRSFLQRARGRFPTPTVTLRSSRLQAYPMLSLS